MKVSILRWLLILLPAFAAVSCSSPEVDNVQTEIDEIGHLWVPDKRESVNNVEIKISGKTYIVSGEVDQPEHKAAIMDYFRDKQKEVIDSLVVLPAHDGDAWGLITVSYGNLRAQPRHAAELLTQAIMGTPVKILKKEGSWLYIQTPDLYLGWITGSSLETRSEDEMEAWRNSVRLIVTAISSVIYSDEKESSVVCDVVLGCIIEVTSVRPGHYNVILPDGRTGFLRRTDCTPFSEWLSKTEATVASLVKYGERLNGVPYLWGGTTVYGLDCSGFMKTIFFINGTILARDASLQQRHGEEIESSATDFSKLQPGDIVFFGNQRTRRAGHVGLYLGDGDVMHESGMVQVNNLSDTRDNFSNYLFTTYLSARRVLGLPSQPGLVAVREHPWYINF